MANSHTLASAEAGDVKALLDWVGKHSGVEAFPVYDYITLPVADARGAVSVPGALRCVTVQWDINDQLVEETPEGEENVVHPVADSAVVIFPGGTITVADGAFTVSNTPISIELEDGSIVEVAR